MKFLTTLAASEWLSNPRFMVPGLVIVETWRTAGFNMLLFYAGLKVISRPRRWRRLQSRRQHGAGNLLHHLSADRTNRIHHRCGGAIWHVSDFNLPWLLSKSGFVEGQGGAGGGLLFPLMQSVASGFGSLRFGQGAAIGVVLLILIVITTTMLFGARYLWRKRLA